jgi:hypothetical protein
MAWSGRLVSFMLVYDLATRRDQPAARGVVLSEHGEPFEPLPQSDTARRAPGTHGSKPRPRISINGSHQ